METPNAVAAATPHAPTPTIHEPGASLGNPSAVSEPRNSLEIIEDPDDDEASRAVGNRDSRAKAITYEARAELPTGTSLSISVFFFNAF